MTAKAKAAIPAVDTHVLAHAARVRESAVDWSPGMKYAKELHLKASSWQAWADEAVPEAAGLEPHPQMTSEFSRIAVGKFVLHRMLLKQVAYVTTVVFFRPRSRWAVQSLPLHRYGREYGVVRFDGDVAIPILANKRLEPWMSPTPAEAMSQRAGYRAARGRVLVAGLGMGWAAKEIKKKPGVRSVTVVEKDPAVARFFGGGFLRSEGVESSVRVDDFYGTDLSGFDSVVADIWPGVGDAGWDERFQKMKSSLKKAGVKVWGWGDYAPKD